MQLCPKPIPIFRLQNQDTAATKQRKFVYKTVACGSRHSLFVMIDAAKQSVQQGMAAVNRYDAVKRRLVLNIYAHVS
ncbi:hypothetical protein EON65_51765 [archaeon]|nr:MAG: hypothetical protein EON65_51765 [archaeon]